MIWGDAVSPLLRGDRSGVALWPIGATEQHGPHLPVDTDTRIAAAVCSRASAALPATVVLPALPIGCSSAHTDRWPGTLALMPRTFIGVVVEAAGWVEASGWSRLILVNGHVGNTAPLRCAVDELRHTRPTLRVALVNTWELDERVASAFTSDAVDWHANRAETSLLLALAPELVADATKADDPDRTAGTVFSWNVAATSRNGVTGRPSGAEGREGEMLLAWMAEALSRLLVRARVERPPVEEGALT